MRDFRDVYEEHCRNNWESAECEREVHDYIQDAAARNDVNVRQHVDTVDVTIRDNGTEISARFGIGQDTTTGRAYIDREGHAMVEDDNGEYIIIEDIPVDGDMFEREFPNVDKNRRDARKERRQKRADYRRSVL